MPELGPGWARGATAPQPIFGTSVNPIPTGEGRLFPPIPTGPPPKKNKKNKSPSGITAVEANFFIYYWSSRISFICLNLLIQQPILKLRIPTFFNQSDFC